MGTCRDGLECVFHVVCRSAAPLCFLLVDTCFFSLSATVDRCVRKCVSVCHLSEAVSFGVEIQQINAKTLPINYTKNLIILYANSVSERLIGDSLSDQ